ncbi:MAG: hypothetical protein O2821_13190 [Chloroflexi bacterium]|nr:hypothetical protein [Chloroflexota bacterium]MDA1228827.1 hypothetical protein [Chloroflexota bacterium]
MRLSKAPGKSEGEVKAAQRQGHLQNTSRPVGQDEHNQVSDRQTALTHSSSFQEHVNILSSPLMSQRMYSQQRATIMRKISADFGNRYVQRLVEHIGFAKSSNVDSGAVDFIQRKPTFDESWSYGVFSLYGSLYPKNWEKEDNQRKSDIGNNFAQIKAVVDSAQINEISSKDKEAVQELADILAQYDRPITYKESPVVDQALQIAVGTAKELRKRLIKSGKREVEDNLDSSSDGESSLADEISDADLAKWYGKSSGLSEKKSGKTEKKVSKPYVPVPYEKRRDRAIRGIKGEVMRCAKDKGFHYNDFHNAYTIGEGPFDKDETLEIRDEVNKQVEGWITPLLTIKNAKVLSGKIGKGSNFNVGAYDNGDKQILNLHFIW